MPAQHPAHPADLQHVEHLDVGAAEQVAQQVAAVRHRRRDIVQMLAHLRLEEALEPRRQAAGHPAEQGHQQRHHRRALGVVQPLDVARPGGAAALRRQAPMTVSLDQVFDDGAGLGEGQLAVLDDRRLAEWMRRRQRLGRADGLRIPRVGDDLVGLLQFLQQPQDARGAREGEVVDLDHGEPGGWMASRGGRHPGWGARAATWRRRPQRTSLAIDPRLAGARTAIARR